MLSSEIPPPDRKKYLSVKQQVDWHNPFLRLNVDGTLTLNTRQTSPRQLNPVDLRATLIDLPASDWPFGKVVAVQPGSSRSAIKEQFEKEDKALKEAWSRMRTIMNELEIQINLWPSSD